MTSNGSSPTAAEASQERPSRKFSSPEESIKTEKLQIERKTFLFALKENPRGRFLRITEDINGRRDSIIIPAPGLDDFKRLLEEIIRVSKEASPKTETSAKQG